MTTPTPGDLSARLEADFHKAIAPHASKRSQGYIMGAFRAALSALPAAGGGDAVTVSREILENADTGLAISNYKGDLWSEYESPRWELRTALGLPCKSNHTTPQPSAAVHEGVGCVFCDLNTDHRAPCTAVGAQGDGWASGVNACIAWVEKRRHDFEAEYGRVDPTTGAMEFGNTAREEYDCELAEIEEGLRSLLVATPAAGKGVDDATARRAWTAGRDEYARRGHEVADSPDDDDLAAVRAALAAALTRQPVAGDGWRSIVYAALRSIRYNANNGSQDRPPHERLRLIGVEADRAIGCMEASYAAPAATPTDGGDICTRNCDCVGACKLDRNGDKK